VSKTVANSVAKPARIPRRKFILGLICTGVAAWIPSQAIAAIADINEAINKAGRLRMLSQRIAKAYCQLGQGVLPERSAKILAQSVQLFREHLQELKAFAPAEDIKESYVELDRLWQQYQKLIAGKPSFDSARYIATLNEDVLRVAHLATTQLELHAPGNLGRLINIAGRQRMLSQRMAKFYLFHQWGIRSPEMEREAQLARREFSSALDALEKAPENDRIIKNELELARMQWLFFDQALKQQDTGGKYAMGYAENVATTSERLLEVMDRITGYYARIAQPQAAVQPGGRKR